MINIFEWSMKIASTFTAVKMTPNWFVVSRNLLAETSADIIPRVRVFTVHWYRPLKTARPTFGDRLSCLSRVCPLSGPPFRRSTILAVSSPSFFLLFPHFSRRSLPTRCRQWRSREAFAPAANPFWIFFFADRHYRITFRIFEASAVNTKGSSAG